MKRRICRSCLDSKSITLVILPWIFFGCADDAARIEGIHFEHGKPAAAEIMLTYRDTFDSEQYITVAGTNGEFVFENVRSEEAVVGRRVTLASFSEGGGPAVGASHTRRIFPRPGEVIRVRIGDGKATVKGEVEMPAGTPTEMNMNTVWAGQMTTKISWPTPPEGLSPEELEAWQDALDASEESRTLRSKMEHYIIDVSGDGQFALSDVSPGEYTLWIQCKGVIDKGAADEIGVVSRDLVVPETEGVTTVDLGKLILENRENRK